MSEQQSIPSPIKPERGSGRTDGNVQYVNVDDFEQKTIPFGTIGEIVDVRTYRRWLAKYKRRETAYERWVRVINYNLSLVAHLHSYDELRSEGLLMVDKFSQLKADASGRTKWVGGTESAKNNSQNQFNCSFLAVNRLNAFSEAFELLMLGVGVGYRVFSSDINQLPELRHKNLEIEFLPYKALPKNKRLENTEYVNGHDLFVMVGDSRQGWIDAVMAYLMAVTGKVTPSKFIYDFGSVRPAGERLNGFGGTASGHGALKGIIADVQRIVQECPDNRLRSVDCMDIMCAIAKGVVAGSSRRSAMICLFEQGDRLCAEAKVGLYTNPSLAHKSYRSQSNNTCCLSDKPSLEEIRQLLQTCKTEGEPGFNNYSEMIRRRVEAAKTWRPNEPVEHYSSVGTNPCSEILLSAGINGKSGSFCNLTTLPLPNFIKDGQLNYAELEECVRLNTRISLRQTFVDIPMPGWDETQKDERLLGVSITGWQDAFSLLGWETGCQNIEVLLELIRNWANQEATLYAEKLGCNRPLLVTCVKPEGTNSQVYGVSSGLHWDWAPYYIRRVQMSGNDALAKTLIDQGFPCYPSPNDLLSLFDTSDVWGAIKKFDESSALEKRQFLVGSTAVIFEFPVKSYSERTQAEVSAIEQLENLKTFTKHYCDHMPSVTISVKDHEWDEVAFWIDENWDNFITASFFPYFDAKYPLLPYEAISETEYRMRLIEIPIEWQVKLSNNRTRFVIDEVLLNEYEALQDSESDDLLTADCQSGSCPIR